jgi:hypothetical protein
VYVTQITAELERIAAARDAARAAGLLVELPPALLDACAEVVHLAAPSTPSTVAAPATPSAAVLFRMLPLRRAIWHVVHSGNQVDVAEVTARLGCLGRVDQPGVVSNALGYWVAHGQLERVRDGVYHRP